jgi:hypothetical protein
VRLAGTEKQRDDALEALVLQQEIAEELERERKRNKKELAALQHTNATITRQRDEAQRVVLHLRSLINGQTHHMEHIIHSISNNAELTESIEEGFEDLPDDEESGGVVTESPETSTIKNVKSTEVNRLSRISAKGVEEDVNPEMEARLFSNPVRRSKRFSTASIIDVADRHLRDKTDAIADIIRNISEQCAAAVEGLQLAHDADTEEEELTRDKKAARQSHLSSSTAASEDGNRSAHGSEAGDQDADRSSFLHPHDHNSSIPPTPDLVHNRSSTSMSIASSTTTPERQSQQYIVADVPTKIVEDDDEQRLEEEVEHEEPVVTKGRGEGLIHRPAGARISALGSGM